MAKAPMQGLGGPKGQIPEVGHGRPGGRVQRPGMKNAKPATMKEQAAYNKFVGFSMMMLYSDKFLAQAIEMLKDDEPVRQSVAKIASMLALRAFVAAKEQDFELPAAAVLHGGAEIVELVAEVAEAAGLPPMTPDEIEAAWYLAADLFRSGIEGRGLLNTEAVAEDMEHFRKMDEAGELHKVARDIGVVSGGFSQMGAPKQVDGPQTVETRPNSGEPPEAL